MKAPRFLPCCGHPVTDELEIKNKVPPASIALKNAGLLDQPVNKVQRYKAHRHCLFPTLRKAAR